ncbi:MAG: hypothetical protein CME19_16425 [Gemmatimonadetes bacterium]|nr:hypothetical protein [Gemmatimonadota bacterium]
MPIGSVCLIEAGCVGTFLLGDLGLNVPLFFLTFSAAFGGYVLAIGVFDRWSTRTIIGAGCLFRATLLLTEPTLSDDIYRYLWDGTVSLAGINPYLLPPSSPDLSGLAPELLSRVNHSHLPTIYPPLAQAFFAVSVWVSPETWTIRLGLCVAELVTVAFLIGLARSYDLSPTVAIVYFWNPLVLVEGAGQGHIDVLSVSLLVVALLYARGHGYGRAAVAFALSGLTKLLPMVLLPAFWRWAAVAEADGRNVLVAAFTTRAVLVPVVGLGVFVLGYVPYMDVGWQVLGSLSTYASTWSFNGAAYDILTRAGLDEVLTRMVLACVFGLAVVVVSIRKIPPIQGAYVVIGTFLVVTPTLHPWYVVWIVPFLCFYGNVGWIAGSGLVVASYEVLVDYRGADIWEPTAWVKYGILLAALGIWWGSQWMSKRKGASLDVPHS